MNSNSIPAQNRSDPFLYTNSIMAKERMLSIRAHLRSMEKIPYLMKTKMRIYSLNEK